MYNDTEILYLNKDIQDFQDLMDFETMITYAYESLEENGKISDSLMELLNYELSNMHIPSLEEEKDNNNDDKSKDHWELKIPKELPIKLYGTKKTDEVALGGGVDNLLGLVAHKPTLRLLERIKPTWFPKPPTQGLFRRIFHRSNIAGFVITAAIGFFVARIVISLYAKLKRNINDYSEINQIKPATEAIRVWDNDKAEDAKIKAISVANLNKELDAALGIKDFLEKIEAGKVMSEESYNNFKSKVNESLKPYLPFYGLTVNWDSKKPKLKTVALDKTYRPHRGTVKEFGYTQSEYQALYKKTRLVIRELEKIMILADQSVGVLKQAKGEDPNKAPVNVKKILKQNQVLMRNANETTFMIYFELLDKISTVTIPKAIRTLKDVSDKCTND